MRQVDSSRSGCGAPEGGKRSFSLQDQLCGFCGELRARILVFHLSNQEAKNKFSWFAVSRQPRHRLPSDLLAKGIYDSELLDKENC